MIKKLIRNKYTGFIPFENKKDSRFRDCFYDIYFHDHQNTFNSFYEWKEKKSKYYGDIFEFNCRTTINKLSVLSSLCTDFKQGIQIDTHLNKCYEWLDYYMDSQNF